MFKTFREWLCERKYQDAGAMPGGSVGSNSVGSTGDSGGSIDSPSIKPSCGGTTTGDISHRVFGIYPWWGWGYKKECKYGKRKDGKCKKKPKNIKENSLQALVQTMPDDPELNGLIKQGTYKPMLHRSPKIEKMFGVKYDGNNRPIK